ncbi:MAG: YihY/virulence factor BrkB family protein [Candidatus Latescibacterota bacterium]|nr:YihY/virulence factor BrkB family protein [Candidatus Latescibacterota bacterium]
MIILPDAIRQTIFRAHKNGFTDSAAAMAFDFVFALFPAVLVLAAFIEAFGLSPDEFALLIEDWGIVLPNPLMQVLEDNLRHLVSSSEKLLVLGVVGVLVPASASMSTTMSALNRAVGAKEKRSFWQRRIFSVLIIIFLGLFLVALFNAIVFAEQFENWIRSAIPATQLMPSLVVWMRRLGGMFGVLFAVLVIYRYVPAEQMAWKHLLPGGVFFLIVWSIIALSVRFYLLNFSYYNLVSGALGGAIAILLSAYLIACVLLLGGELNATLLRFGWWGTD